MPEPVLHELVNFVKLHGALAASRHYGLGYSIVRRRIRGANFVLNRGRRRDKSLTPRNAQIRVQRMQGAFLIDIGKAFGLGRERIRQILAATGGDPLRVPEESEEASQSSVAWFDGSSESRNAGVNTATSIATSAVQPTPTQAETKPAQGPAVLPTT
jgi:hypothetical protein